MSSNPFNLPPAPSVKPRYVQKDLGAYSPDHTGWIIVFDIDTNIGANEAAFKIADNKLTGEDRMQAMYDWIAAICVAWNFTQTSYDQDGNETVGLIPQPRNGGAKYLPQALLKPISEAFADSAVPEKNS